MDHLSGGQQQRVAIARALYQRPQMILADEPVSAVDPERAKSLVELLIGLSREEGQTLVMSLHDIDLAKRYFDRVIGLRKGQVVMDGAPDEVDLTQALRSLVMRRRLFFLLGVFLFFVGLWVTGAKPSELLPNEGGRETASKFLMAAFSPALDFEDPEMRESEVDFIHKLGRVLGLTLRYAVAAMSLALLIGIIWGILGSRAWWSRSSLFLQTIRIGSRLMATAGALGS